MAEIYDESIPPDSQKVKLGAQRLRELTENVEDTLGVDHVVDSTGEGMHKKVTLGNANVPILEIANKIILYGDDVDSIAELHTMDEGDRIIQLTSQGNLCVTNTKQPAAGEADKVLLYAGEDSDSNAKLRAIDEDDNIIPLENHTLWDTDLIERTVDAGGGLVAETNLTGTFTGTEGEIYECLILGKFKKYGHASTLGVIRMYDANSRSIFYASGGSRNMPWFGLLVVNSDYSDSAVKGLLKITTTGEISLRQQWAASQPVPPYGTTTIYCTHRYMYVKRVA